MTIEDYNNLEPQQKMLATLMTIAIDNGGELLVTSGKLEALSGRQQLVWDYDLDFPKIVKVKVKFKQPPNAATATRQDEHRHPEGAGI